MTFCQWPGVRPRTKFHKLGLSRTVPVRVGLLPLGLRKSRTFPPAIRPFATSSSLDVKSGIKVSMSRTTPLAPQPSSPAPRSSSPAPRPSSPAPQPSSPAPPPSPSALQPSPPAPQSSPPAPQPSPPAPQPSSSASQPTLRASQSRTPPAL
ncbi:hypothetical protein Dimus_038645 [Dionaea muscipula]